MFFCRARALPSPVPPLFDEYAPYKRPSIEEHVTIGRGWDHVGLSISGLALLVIGAIIQDVYSDYTDFLHGKFFAGPILLIIVGIIVFVVAFFGCCGAVKENHCMIITYSVFLLIIFGLELAGGITGYVLKQDVQSMLEDSLNTTSQRYGPANKDITNAWDIMQNDLGCCGIQGAEDWKELFPNGSLPHSCCPNLALNYDCTLSLTHSTKGCLPSLQATIEHYALVLGGVGIGIGVVQLIGVIFACCLAKSIRKEYETV
uniref:Tetraspanin n=1 Tax=Timema douglasi TaxID=61478 RepID=A0A7R8V9P2_TIMDO|nr:unnamed protein product [Timema douglasi]